MISPDAEEVAVGRILQSLSDSEINFRIDTLWGRGFDWKLGDPVNGFKAEGTAAKLTEAVTELAAAACQHYPESDFAKRC